MDAVVCRLSPFGLPPHDWLLPSAVDAAKHGMRQPMMRSFGHRATFAVEVGETQYYSCGSRNDVG
jgi:hypothetical protein